MPSDQSYTKDQTKTVERINKWVGERGSVCFK